MTEGPHRRYNPLADKWVLVSPHRIMRPWQGEEQEPEPRPLAYDPDCYLCPGNTRVTGEKNPAYAGVHLFPNDFPALLKESDGTQNTAGLFQRENVRGECQVLCFSPDHDKSLPELSLGEVAQVIAAWCSEAERLGQDYSNVQIFENKGPMMGCSNPHPHGQIWASDHVPDEVRIEDRMQATHYLNKKQNLLLGLAAAEAEACERVVVQNEDWLAIVPYWASWPFETLVLPRFPVAHLPELDEKQKSNLAGTIRELTIRYDNLFRCSFPYSMGWHGAPCGDSETSHWQLHAHFYPPLLRSASVRKFMVGYEMLAEAQRDLTPERAAEMLRAVSDVHYRD
ncbi:UDP-glucose--hexose-1-phosphate uridylyltransferase [Parasphingorhabdus sp.]|uniref:UDP-glucose--hexose-1-phosphate uridylyltransferase n=1 Tax=Parasphingorhabdus sp. TaxID=2709688 RepID=UPI0030037DF2